MLKGIALGEIEGIQDLIQGADPDHEATGTEKGTILDTTAAGIVVLLQDIGHEAALLEDRTTEEGLTPEAVQEAEDTMDSEEPSTPRLIDIGEAVPVQDLAVELLCA